MQRFLDDEEQSNVPQGASPLTLRSEPMEQPDPWGPAPQSPPPEEPPPMSLKDLMAKEDKNNNTKQYLNVLGGIAQNFEDVPSSNELLYGGKGYHRDVKGMMKNVADGMGSPMDREAKAMAYMKAKREDNAGAATDKYTAAMNDPNSKESKAIKQMALKFGVPVDDSAPGADYLRLFDPKAMNEAKIKGDVDRDNRAQLFQMEQAERTRDKKELKAGDAKKKAESDYEKLVTNTEQHAASLRGDDAAKLSSAKLSAIASGRALLKQYEGREDEMTPDQLSILAADRVKAVTGGVPTNEEMKHMMPSNMGTTWSGTKAYFTGKPEPANSGGWVREAETDFQAQEKAARDILKNRQDQITSNPRLRPEDKARISKMAVPPEALSVPETPTKVVNGITYQKVPGGWQQISAVGQR